MRRRTTEYRCVARPADNGGQVCGAPARDHSINNPEIESPTTGRAIKAHQFLPDGV